jgi:hypothetical protein
MVVDMVSREVPKDMEGGPETVSEVVKVSVTCPKRIWSPTARSLLGHRLAVQQVPFMLLRSGE